MTPRGPSLPPVGSAETQNGRVAFRHSLLGPGPAPLLQALRSSPAPGSHVEVLKLVHMEAAAPHAGLRRPAGGAIGPGGMLGLAHGVAIEVAGAPEGGTGRRQLWTVARVGPEGQLTLAISVIVLARESHGQRQGRRWLV